MLKQYRFCVINQHVFSCCCCKHYHQSIAHQFSTYRAKLFHHMFWCFSYVLTTCSIRRRCPAKFTRKLIARATKHSLTWNTLIDMRDDVFQLCLPTSTWTQRISNSHKTPTCCGWEFSIHLVGHHASNSGYLVWCDSNTCHLLLLTIKEYVTLAMTFILCYKWCTSTKQTFARSHPLGGVGLLCWLFQVVCLWIELA